MQPSFTRRWGRISAAVTVQGLSISEGDVDMSYKAVNIAGGYNFLAKKRFRANVVGGYHYTDFDYLFDDEDTGVKTSTDFTLTGPYIAVRVGW
jgi:hypothetical protein